jgi:hypothetical protein
MMPASAWDPSPPPPAKVSYYAPATLAARHHLSADLAARLAAVDPITDALVAP